MIRKIRARLKQEAFTPSYLGILVSPFYIIRSNLYKTIRNLSPNITGDVLDFGCGSKPYEDLFDHAKTYIGVDIQVSGHNHGDSKVDYYYDGENLPFENGQFDSVVCFEVFEHVFNIDQVIAQIHRVLRNDGLILISTPFAWDEHEIPYDFARYTSFAIRHILERGGFEVVELQKTTSYVLAVGQLAIAYLFPYLLSRNRTLSWMGQILIICPLTIFSLFINALLPKRYELYCNNVVLARKIPAPISP